MKPMMATVETPPQPTPDVSPRPSLAHYGSGTSSTFRPWHVAALAVAGLFGRSSRVAAIPGIDRRTLDAHSDFPNPLSYLAAGGATAQRVIFVHGTPGSATSWLDFLADVPGGFEFIAVDRPGFGHSCTDQATFSLDAQAAALRPLLVRRNGRSPLVVGHSFGATIAAKLAAKYPSQVGGLILVAAAMDPELEKIHLLQHIAEMWPLVRLLPKAMRNSNRELLALKDELTSLTNQLAAIDCPVSILHGTKDNLVPYGNVAFMKRYIPIDCLFEVITLTGRNHFIPWNSKPFLDLAVAKTAHQVRCVHIAK